MPNSTIDGCRTEQSIDAELNNQWMPNSTMTKYTRDNEEAEENADQIRDKDDAEVVEDQIYEKDVANENRAELIVQDKVPEQCRTCCRLL